MPVIQNKTAYIGQPRVRTGTRCDCNKKLTTKKCQDETLSKDLVVVTIGYHLLLLETVIFHQVHKELVWLGADVVAVVSKN